MSDEKFAQTFLFPCNQCGAELKYLPGSSHIKCNYCGNDNEITKSQDFKVEELDLNAYISQIENENLVAEKFVNCKSCGASSTISGNIKSFHCPYCRAPLINDDANEERVIKPAYILPFEITDKKVYEILSKWIGGLWFAPNNLKKAALSPIGLHGVYVPYWTFDAHTDTTYTGARGENYTVTVGSGDNKRTETRTKWYDTSGTIDDAFHDDILVFASGNIESSHIENLEPWDLSKLEAMDEKYLSGFVTEKYNLNLINGYNAGKRIIDENINYMIRQQIGGDAQKIYSVNTVHSNLKFKHILVPIYVSSYRYESKIYHFYVNGRNGKMSGTRPYSTVKIAFAVFLIICFIVIIYLITGL